MDFSPELIAKYPSLQKLQDRVKGVVKPGGPREEKLPEYIRQRQDFEQLKNNPRKLLAAIDDFSYHHEYLITIGADKGRILNELLDAEQPHTLIELGGYVGYSAILFGDWMRRNVTTTSQTARVWSLELEPRFVKIMTELISIAGLSDIITVLTGPAEESLQGLKTRSGVTSVDWLFIDHEKTSYTHDLRLCEALGLLRSGSTIIADNVLNPGVPDYRAYVRAHGGMESYGVRCLIMPGESEDEVEVSKVL